MSLGFENKESFAVYVHWPFCASKCPYCDFNSHVAQSVDQSLWRDAYSREIAHYAARTPGRVVTSVFFGGGTPSLMAPQTVQSVLEDIAQQWTLAADCEITLEANPTSVEAQKFRDFAACGVNRLSLGVQSFREDGLHFLGRQHDAPQARKAIALAAETFSRFSFDLIYARPQQTLQDWKDELSEALALAGGHLSLYQLTIEKGTPFFARHAQGLFDLPQEDLGADLYIATQEITERAGLPAYEISNHAAAGHESRHNLTYWRYQDYIGIGPGAHGRFLSEGNKQATMGAKTPSVWLERVQRTGCGEDSTPQALTPDETFTEALLMGLRLREGIPLSRLESLGEKRLSVIKCEALRQEGLLLLENGWIKATREGMLRLESLFRYLL